MLMEGLTHPLTGVDHLLAMFAVGLWSALTHENIRAAIWTPVSFLCLLLVGALLGMAGLSLPAIEPIIMASLLVLGLLVASRVSLPNWASAALVGFFALFHGIAHGAELPMGGSAAAFIVGFMLTTFALHIVGLATGFTFKQRGLWLTRLAGAGIAAYGVALFAA
jgi:urease accessory protein